MTAVLASRGHGEGQVRQCGGHPWDCARHRGTVKRVTAPSYRHCSSWQPRGSTLSAPLNSTCHCLQFAGEETEAGEAMSSCHWPRLTRRRERRLWDPPLFCPYPRCFQVGGFFCLLCFLILSLFLSARSRPAFTSIGLCLLPLLPLLVWKFHLLFSSIIVWP